MAAVSRTGLQLLLSVLWRRVGPDGDVRLVGGSRGLRAQLSSLGIGPRSARAAAFGSSPAPSPPAAADDPSTSRPWPSLLDLPAPRRPSRGRRAPSCSVLPVPA